MMASGKAYQNQFIAGKVVFSIKKDLVDRYMNDNLIERYRVNSLEEFGNEIYCI